MSDWSPHETDQHRAAGPVPDCDCHACAIDERNRLRAEVEAWKQTAETFRADNAALLASSDSYRAEVEGLRDDMAKTTGLLVRANTEVERLTAENKAAWDSAEYNAKRARKAEAETEELQAEIRLITSPPDSVGAVIASLRAEVEGLRDDMASTTGLLVRANDEAARLRAEVERYRKAIETHRANVWGCPVTREVGHPEDAKLYAALRGGEAGK